MRSKGKFKYLVIIIALLFLLYTCKGGEGKMKVSSVFGDGGKIPVKYTCDGENISPPLTIENIPEDTKTLAIIVDDPDAPIGTFVHWVAWNIQVNGNSVKIPEGIPRNYKDFDQGMNDFRRIGYDGPCPPKGHGIHHYYFKIYALKDFVKLPPSSTKKALENAIRNLIIEETKLIGIYQR